MRCVFLPTFSASLPVSPAPSLALAPAARPTAQPDVVTRMINDADIKQNGKIDQGEFLAIMRKTEALEAKGARISALTVGAAAVVAAGAPTEEEE